jgi:putative addiction module component (TIGR02574 family)
MSAKEHVIIEAMKLPEAERLEVAERLFESLEGQADPEAEEAWASEIERRIQSIDAGQARFLTWEQARARIEGEGDGSTPR